MKTRRILKKSIITIVLIILSIYLYFQNQSVAGKRGAVEITTAKIEKGSVEQVVQASGMIEPAVKMKVRVEAEGNIRDKKAKDGMIVKKGDILLEVDQEKLKKEVLNAEIKLRRLQSNLKNMLENTGPYEAAQSKNNLVKSKISLEYAEKNLISTERIFKEEIATRRQYEEAQRALETAKLDYQITEQQVDNSKQRFEKDVQDAKGEIQMAEEDLKEARQKYEKAIVKAPISGSVIEDILKEKRNVGYGEEVFTIGDLSKFNAKIKVDELDISKVKLGQPVLISSEAFKNVKLPGHVIEIASQATRVTFAEIEVLVQIDSTLNQPVRPNLSVDADIQTMKEANVLKIPAEALVKKDTTNFVFVVKGNRVKKTLVKTGLVNLQNVVIEKGLKVGDVIAVQGAFKLKDKDMVKIKPVKATTK